MANYEKPWIKEGAFFPVYLTPTLHFYFDSKQLFSNLINHPKPDLYNCYSQDNEFGCTIRFENIENLKDFFKHLNEITELSYDEIISITENDVWSGHADDLLEEIHGSREEAGKLMDEVDNFLKGLY
jgi:hypothetical protein|tara:strand:+ start:129 stop:509 length:381 start_codon:yes stop_codon:yes gene_type:complete